MATLHVDNQHIVTLHSVSSICLLTAQSAEVSKVFIIRSLNGGMLVVFKPSIMQALL